MRTQILFANLIFLFLCVSTMIGSNTASAGNVYAIFEIPKSGRTPFFRRATERCERSRMRMATPTMHKAASAMESLMTRCIPSGVPVLVGGHSVQCSNTSTLYFWSPELNAPSYPVEDKAAYCGKGARPGKKMGCTPTGRSRGRLFYQFDKSVGTRDNCTRPVAMDYDPANAYRLTLPEAGKEGLLAWVVPHGGAGGSSVELRNLQPDQEDVSRAYAGESSEVIAHVMCEGGRSSVVSFPLCYSIAYASVTVVGASSRTGIHWLVVVFLSFIGLILVCVVALSVFWGVSLKTSAMSDEVEGSIGGGRSLHSVGSGVHWHRGNQAVGSNANGDRFSRRGSFSGSVASQQHGAARGGSVHHPEGNWALVVHPQGGSSGRNPQTQNAVRSNRAQRQSSFGTNGAPSRGNSYGGGLQRPGSFRSGGPNLSHRGGFTGSASAATGIAYGTTSPRPDNGRGTIVSRQASFTHGDVPQQSSVYNDHDPPAQRDPRSAPNLVRGALPEQVSLSSVGFARQNNLPNVGTREGSFRGLERGQRGSFRISSPSGSGLFNT